MLTTGIAANSFAGVLKSNGYKYLVVTYTSYNIGG